MPSAEHFEPTLLRLTSVGRYGNRLLAREVRAGDRRTPTCDRRGSTAGDDLAAMATGARAEIEQLIGILDHLAIVLDDQQRVTQVAEFFQCAQQPRVVAGMQPDRRFVQHVQHAAQSAADLGRQPDPLHLAAGKRRGGPGQGQVLQAHLDQELRAVVDLAGHFAGDLPLGRIGFPTREFLDQLTQGHAAILVDRSPPQPHGRRVVAQPAPVADRAFHVVDQMLQPAAEAG